MTNTDIISGNFLQLDSQSLMPDQKSINPPNTTSKTFLITTHFQCSSCQIFSPYSSVLSQFIQCPVNQLALHLLVEDRSSSVSFGRRIDIFFIWLHSCFVFVWAWLFLGVWGWDQFQFIQCCLIFILDGFHTDGIFFLCEITFHPKISKRV